MTGASDGIGAALLGLGVLAALALIAVGGRALVTRRGDRLKAALMVGAGVVVLINVWLYSLPSPGRQRSRSSRAATLSARAEVAMPLLLQIRSAQPYHGFNPRQSRALSYRPRVSSRIAASRPPSVSGYMRSAMIVRTI